MAAKIRRISLLFVCLDLDTLGTISCRPSGLPSLTGMAVAMDPGRLGRMCCFVATSCCSLLSGTVSRFSMAITLRWMWRRGLNIRPFC